MNNDTKRACFEIPRIIDITSVIEPDSETEKIVHQELEKLKDPSKNKELVLVRTALDGRFFSIRTQETGLGNLVCDASKLEHCTNLVY